MEGPASETLHRGFFRHPSLQPHPSAHQAVNHALTRPHATESCQSPETLSHRILLRPPPLIQPTGSTAETTHPHWCSIPAQSPLPFPELVNINPRETPLHPRPRHYQAPETRILSRSLTSATNPLIPNTHQRLSTVDTCPPSAPPHVLLRHRDRFQDRETGLPGVSSRAPTDRRVTRASRSSSPTRTRTIAPGTSPIRTSSTRPKSTVRIVIPTVNHRRCHAG